jgi:hypothetical protein
VLSQIRSVLSSLPKIEASSARVRLTEVTPATINVEVVCYVLTREFDEYATVREDLLLRIMSFIEDSGTNLASTSQTLYLSTGSEVARNKDKDKADSKRGNAPADANSTNRLKLEAALREPKPSPAKHDGKDD